MMRVIHKTKNGWLLSCETFLCKADVPEYFVFETMRSLTTHLLKLAGESAAKRDAKGHFCRCKKKVAM